MGQVTDDDLDKVGGNFDKLTGLLQEKYGYTQQQAKEESGKEDKMSDYKRSQDVPAHGRTGTACNFL